MGIGIISNLNLHPLGNGTVEIFIKKLSRDCARLVLTVIMEWDEYFTLACFRYKIGVIEETGRTSLKELFDVNNFEVCTEMNLDYIELKEPH